MATINASAENYLETILIIKERKGNVRAIDVATELEFSKPSVSIALKHLRESGHITVDENGYLSLTPLGMSVASDIYDRHVVLTGFFTKLGVDNETAQKDACKIEHIISAQTFECIKKSMEK